MADQTGIIQIPVELVPGVPYRIPMSKIFGDTYSIYGSAAAGVSVSIADYRLYPSSDTDEVESALLPLLNVSVGGISQILPIGKNSNNSGDNALTFIIDDDLRGVASSEFRMSLDVDSLGPRIPMKFVVVDGDFPSDIGRQGVHDVIYIEGVDGTAVGAIEGSAAALTLSDSSTRGNLGLDFTIGDDLPAKTVRVSLGAFTNPVNPTADSFGQNVVSATDDSTYPKSATPNAKVADISLFAAQVVSVAGGTDVPVSGYVIPRWGSHHPIVAKLLLRFSISNSQ